MFAIISGLDHKTVQRLQTTWERVSDKYKNIFEKGYLSKWTEEVFKIVEVLRTNPITYVIMDSNGEIIKGSFYEQELLKSQFDFEEH